MQSGSDVLTDGEIIDRILSGEVDTFRILMRRYNPLVLAVVRRHVPTDSVDDVMQEAFVRIYQSLPKLKTDDGFRTWLSVIAVRTCYDFWRERYRHRELPMSSLTEEQEKWVEAALADYSCAVFSEERIRDEGREILDMVLDRLSAADRMVVELVYLEGLSIKEACELTGWSSPKVRVRLFRARRKLQEFFAPRGRGGI